MWNQLDRPLKISVLSSTLGGSLGLIAMSYVILASNFSFLSEATPVERSLIIGFLLIPLWLGLGFTGGLFSANIWVMLFYPVFLGSGGLLLLGLPMEREKRGILGFLVFMGSVPFVLGLLLGVLAAIASLFGMPLFRS